jgi:hypothetical protein
MTRRLSRRSKDRACMRQLGMCGYCARVLCDAFEVDHLNENRCDDRELNLVATCALCHAIKSRHVRLRRDWSRMRQALHDNLVHTLDRWQNGAGHADLPLFLQYRVPPADCERYAWTTQVYTPQAPLDLEQYRYTAGRDGPRRSG